MEFISTLSIIGIGLGGIGIGLGGIGGLSIVGYYFLSYIFLNKNDHKALIIDNNYKSVINITHITNDDIEVKNYIQKCLEYFYIKNENENQNEHENQNENENEIFISENVSKILLHNNIYVEYSLNNNTYSICVNGELKELKKEKEIVKNTQKIKRKILTGYIESKERNEKICVKKLLKEFQGPEHNFYNNLEGVSKKIEDILYPYNLLEWDTLIINDLFGDTTKIDLTNLNNNELNWDNCNN